MVASRMLSKILDRDSTSLAVNAREMLSPSSWIGHRMGRRRLLACVIQPRRHNAAQVMEVPSVLGQGRERRRLPPRLRAEQRRQGWRLLRSYVPEPRRSTEGPRWSFGAVPTKAGNAASDPADATKAGNLASDPPGPRPRRQGMRLPTCPGRGHEGREGGFRPCSHP